MGVQIRIGDLARMLNVPISSIRFYTETGVIKTHGRTQAGHLLYDPDESIKQFKMIANLKKKRYTLKQIKQYIQQGNTPISNHK